MKEGIATHSSILAWRIPGTGEPWQVTVHEVAKSWTRLKLLSMHAELDHFEFTTVKKEILSTSREAKTGLCVFFLAAPLSMRDSSFPAAAAAKLLQ